MKSLPSILFPALLRLTGQLPLWLLRGVGNAAGYYNYWCRTRMAAVTRRNIERCFPDRTIEQQRHLEKTSLRETGRLAGEILAIWTRDTSWTYNRIVGVQGLDVAKDYLARGKGLIVLAPHLGNWEVLGIYLSTLGQVTNLYEPPKRQEFEDLVRTSREKAGAKLVPTNNRGVAALLQALKRGELTGILPDQTPNLAGGTFSEFFGQPTFTMTLVHKLIERTGCSAVYGYAKRVDGGFEVIFRPAESAIYSSDEEESVRALNRGIETCVLDVPEQYQWEYKRFKRQPGGVNFYEGSH